ncbi:MAG: N-acetylmuramoyl-L-alanine amidase [Candidatus Omnitrophota bacterium]
MFKKIVVVVFLSLVLAGCATGVRYQRIDTFNIDSSSYVSIIELCKVHDIDWQWDNFSSILNLKKGNDQASILVGSSTAEINGQKQTIAAPFLFHRGSIAVPLDFKKRFVGHRTITRPFTRKEPAAYFGYKISKVVIDAGHGGKDPGAVSRSGGKEKSITLDIAKRLKKVLESRGIKTILTRSSDQYISLSRRAQISNKSGADLFISIHVNAHKSRQPYGFETYYFSEASDNIARALEVAENASYTNEASTNSSRNLKAILGDMIYTENIAASKEVAKHICDNTCSIMGVRNRGIKSARFAVLKNADIPAILVEVGFISNPKEEKALRNSFYRQQIAEGLAAGIANYKRIYRLTKK